jgi:hypothetical protein
VGCRVDCFVNMNVCSFQEVMVTHLFHGHAYGTIRWPGAHGGHFEHML